MFGEILKKYRNSKNLSIKDLAVKVNMDSSLLSRIENEKRLPSKENIQSFVNALEIKHEELVKAWLEDKISGILTEYLVVAPEVLKALETRIEYLKANSVSVIPDLPKKLKTLINEIENLKNEWQLKKPLNKSQLQKLEEHFKVNYTFESNRIEGNTLTLQETFLVINQGLTIGGKSMQEHLEAINHDEAIEFIYDLAQKQSGISEFQLKQIHHLVLKGIDRKNAGSYRNVQVRIGGSKHIPPEPYLIAKLMEDYFITYQSQENKIHPVILAADMHERLVSIHPFIDGNGRTSRLIMNLILLQNGFPIANLKGNQSSRLKYYKALESVQVGNNPLPFYELILKTVKQSLQEHLALT